MIHRKQGRYDIKAKVKIQSPIPTSLYTIPNSHVKKMQGGGFVYLPSHFYHTYLVCILFGVSSLHFLHFQCFIFLFLYFFMLFCQLQCQQQCFLWKHTGTDMVDKGYSKTSINRPFEKQTTSVQRIAHLPPIDFITELIHFEPPGNRHLSTRNNGHCRPRHTLFNTKLPPKTATPT